MDNTNKVVDYILANAGKLKPEKIQALGEVIASLGEKNPATEDPNNIPEQIEYQNFDQESRIPIDQIDGFSFEGDKTIYKTRPVEAPNG